MILKRWTIALLTLLLWGMSSTAQTPAISCLSVEADSSVWIYWSGSDATVLQQTIWYSTDGSTFVNIATIDQANPGLSSYQHLNTDAFSGPCYYYVRATYASQTLDSPKARTMHLQVQERFTDPGIIELSWNPMDLGESDYAVWFEWPQGTWTEVATGLTNTLYNHQLPDDLCSDTVTYRITCAGSSCTSQSSTAGGWFSETQQPLPATFDSLTVDASGHVVIAFTPSVSTDAATTLIYRNNLPIATIPLSDPTVYIDTNSDACTDAGLVYALAAGDHCGNKSGIDTGRELSPVFQHEPQPDLCDASVTLSWDAYTHPLPALTGYQVLRSTSGGPFEMIDQVTTATTWYVASGLDEHTTYTFAIRALFASGSSTSCQKTITMGTYSHPQWIYLANASVMPDGSTQLTLDVDLLPPAGQWNILRDDGSGYQTIRTLNRAGLSATPWQGIDSTASGLEHPCTYVVEVIDSCGRGVLTSNTMTTMWLQGESTAAYDNILTWTAFDGFDGGLWQYRILRADGSQAPVAIDSTGPGVLTYTDATAGNPPVYGTYTYTIEAMESGTDSYGYSEQSLSNPVTFGRETRVYMPDAFRPGGLTPRFGPVFAFFNGSMYRLQLFNRWGQQIWEGQDPADGWDGTVNGTAAPAGAYVWRLSFTSWEGVSVMQEGMVMLVR